MDSHWVTERDFCVCPVNIYPRDSQRLDSVFVAKENQIRHVICSVSLVSVLQTVLMFTYTTLEVPAMLPTPITPELSSSHFFVLSLQVTSRWETRKNSLKHLRVCSLHTPDAELAESWANENGGVYPELTTFTKHHSDDGRSHETPWKSIYCWGIFKDLNKGSLHYQGSGYGGLAKARCQRHLHWLSK